MAHLKKNTRGAVPGLAVHFERKTDYPKCLSWHCLQPFYN